MNSCLLFLWIFVQQCYGQQRADKECAFGCKKCFNGHCLGCKSDYYGQECTSRCNDKCIQDGSCQGKVCLNGCRPPYYGSGCTQTCFFCTHGCHRNGSCKRPKKEYIEDFPKTKKSNEKVGAVLKAVAATVSITVVTCVITACCRPKKETSRPDFQDVVVDRNYDSSSDDSTLNATRNVDRGTRSSSHTHQSRCHADFLSVAAFTEESDRRRRNSGPTPQTREGADYTNVAAITREPSVHTPQSICQIEGPDFSSVGSFNETSNRRRSFSHTRQLPFGGLEGPDYSSVALSDQEVHEGRTAPRDVLSSLDGTPDIASGVIVDSTVSSESPHTFATPPPPYPSPPPPPDYSSGNAEAPPPSYSSLFPDRVQR